MRMCTVGRKKITKIIHYSTEFLKILEFIDGKPMLLLIWVKSFDFNLSFKYNIIHRTYIGTLVSQRGVQYNIKFCILLLLLFRRNNVINFITSFKNYDIDIINYFFNYKEKNKLIINK